MNLIWVADFVTLALNTKKEYTVSYPSCLSRCLLMFMIYFRGHLKSPWSHRKRKHVLSPLRWRSFFAPDGKLRNGGVKFLKKVRSGVSSCTLVFFENRIFHVFSYWHIRTFNVCLEVWKGRKAKWREMRSGGFKEKIIFFSLVKVKITLFSFVWSPKEERSGELECKLLCFSKSLLIFSFPKRKENLVGQTADHFLCQNLSPLLSNANLTAENLTIFLFFLFPTVHVKGWFVYWTLFSYAGSWS